MKAFLMFRDRDFDMSAEEPDHAGDLIADLEAQTLIDAMAAGDKFLAEVARAALLQGLEDPEEIAYRQDALEDARENPAVVRELYALAVEALQRQRKIFGWMSDRYPKAILSYSIEVLELLTQMLRTLRQIAAEHEPEFSSDAFTGLFATLQAELDDAYFEEIQGHLRRLRLRHGVLMGASLGTGGKNADLTLLRRPSQKRTLGEKLGALAHPFPSFSIAPRDEAGGNALAEIEGRGVALVADALARSTDHILSFFAMLRAEFAFYIGALNLEAALAEAGQPVCRPRLLPAGEAGFSCTGLYDASLALLSDTPVVGNDIAAEGRRLVVVTGANRGGKSTFLRSLGLAQLMAQSGLPGPAAAFRTGARTGVYTHFKREEDASMSSGKLDEELERMSRIAARITPGSLLLLNESFASTNEREGSEIGRQVTRAMLACGIQVAFVTHQYDLAHGFLEEADPGTLFLRAGRERTFRLQEAEPLTTSFGGDIYRRVFADSLPSGR